MAEKKIIGHIIEAHIVHGNGIEATAKIVDQEAWDKIQRSMMGAPVGFSIGGTGVVHELTRWQSFRIRLGGWIIKLGMKVGG